MRLAEQGVLTVTFPISGAVTTLLGPLLPSLALRWSLSDAQAGQLFLAQFLGSTLGAIGAGPLGARVGPARLVALAYLAMGMAVAALGVTPFPGGLACVAVYGYALGTSIPTVNLLAAAGSPGGEVGRLNLLNLAWCTGALAAPPLVAILLRAGGTGGGVAAMGGLCLVCAGACFLSLRAAESRGGSAGHEPRPAITRRDYRAAIAAGLFQFLYVGVENGLNGWLPLFGQRIAGAGAASSAAALSAFWGCILAARLLASRAASRMAPRIWVLGGLAVALAGICLLLAGGGPAPLIAGAAAAGFGLGPIFPTAVALFEQRAKAAAAPLIGFVFAAGGCGGGALPWLIGTVSSSSGSLRTGLATLLAAMAGMLLLRRRL